MMGIGLIICWGVLCAEPPAELAKLQESARPAIEKGVEYLRTAVNDNGSFGNGALQVPITAMVVSGLIQSRAVPVSDPMIVKGLAFLQSKVQPDGGMESGRVGRTYTTAIVVMTFNLANHDGKYDSLIKKMLDFLKAEQWDEADGIDSSDPRYGGMGYGGGTRPDLSNTAFVLEAMKEAGVPEDDPTFQRAIIFIRRCQNLSGDGANDLTDAGRINDGGFYYTPIHEARGLVDPTDEGNPSYGTMTYAGLKSFLYAGVKPDDFRVQAAMKWIREHYTLSENPGKGTAGLYYYYHTFAKALATLGLDDVVDANDVSHDWRADLVNAILERQRKDGSWANQNRMWMENDPRLATSFALLSLGQVLYGPPAN